jgi:hypothetical protein
MAVSSIPTVRRLRHKLRTRLSEQPALYLPFARRKYPGPSPQVISADTELVIDGYTRAATTFAVYAFQLAQHRPVRIAHHLHAPAQLIAAAKRKVPTLVTIREPEGTILSQLVREPNVAMRDALVAYVRFYSRLLPYRCCFVVGDFQEVTRDFAAVVRRLNAHFGTSFDVFVSTEGNLQECFELMQQRFTLSRTLLGFESGLVTVDEVRALRRRSAGSQVPSGSEAWVPSDTRARSKALLQDEWRQAGLARLRDRAWRVYEDFRRERGPRS